MTSKIKTETEKKLKTDERKFRDAIIKERKIN